MLPISVLNLVSPTARRRALGDGRLEPLVGLPQVMFPRVHRLQIAAPMVIRFARQPVDARAGESRTRNQDQRRPSDAIDRVDDAHDRAQIHRRHDRQYADRGDDIESQIELPTPWRPQ
jgi:hypothetical protein